MEKFCTNCGAPLEEDALFCSECGEKILPAGEIPDTNFVAAAAAAVPAAAVAAAQPAAAQPAADPFELPRAEANPQPDPQFQNPNPIPNQYQAPGPNQYQYQYPNQYQPQQEPFMPQETEYGTVTTAAASRSPEVKTSTYFWLMLLFAIPVIGFISVLVMAFASKNNNIKHWCRAMLIWILIGVIVSGVLTLVIVLALKGADATIDLGKIWEAIQQAAGL